MSVSVKQIGEFGFIDRIKRRACVRSDVIKGIGDDAAVTKPVGRHLQLIATDMLVENVHFTKRDRPQDIGHKALACNISDIAAMGGLPKHAVVSLGVPSRTPTKVLENIYAGINKCAKKYSVSLVGGDTVRAKELIINVALTGQVAKKDLVLRSGARVGDQIFVTGALGNSLKSKKHLKIIPRVAEAQMLCRAYKPHAMIDVSDGLAADLGHILRESKVGAVLYADKIPLNKGAKLQNALYDGEDFELICVLSCAKAKKLTASRDMKKYSFTCIGEIVEQRKGARIIDAKGKSKKLDVKGYSHF